MTRSIFRYRNIDKKIFKKNKGYNGYVNDHHIIPKEHRNHGLLSIIDFDIHSNFNLFIMPTEKTLTKFNLHPDTMIHMCHPKYNKYVKKELDAIYRTYETHDEYNYYIWLLVNYLKSNLVFNKDNIPW